MTHRTQRRSALVALAATALTTPLVTLASPATADPREGVVASVACDDGNAYSVIARGGATWNAQLVTDSSSVFHLTAYTITFEVTHPDGTVETFGPSTFVKGGNDRTNKGPLRCDFSFDLAFDDGSTAHATGVANGWLTPSSR